MRADILRLARNWELGGRPSLRVDPDWKKLSDDPQYRENVSAISDIILRPTSYSQI
jgi:hypothetical protein